MKFKIINLFCDDAIKCRPGQHTVTIAHRLPADAAEVLQKLGKVAADHGFGHGAGQLAVFNEEAVLGHAVKVAAGAGLAAGEY